MPEQPAELFVLMRNGQPYAFDHDRERLLSIVTTNPDFTMRENDGTEPQATIVRYVLADALNV